MSEEGEKVQVDVNPRTARILCGMSQEEMAKMLRMHRVTYSEYERDPGRFSMAQAWQFCKIVKLPLEEVFNEKRARR